MNLITHLLLVSDSSASENLLPLTQLHGGGPTEASVCEDGIYYNGKLFVTESGLVVFRPNGSVRK